jgi:hypothetical protein
MNLLLHKITSRFVLSGFLFILPVAGLWAGSPVVFSGISLSNSTPLAGSVVGVTVIYCDSTTYDVPFFHVGLNPNFTSFQSCPAANQEFLVDSNTSPTGVSPVSSSVNDTSDSGNGWAGIGTGGTATCPATQVFNVTIPASISGGTYNLIVEENSYYVGCANPSNAVTYATINIPLPPPALSVTKSVGTTVAAPDSLILFNLNYTYVNTSNVVLADTVPANTTLVQMSSGGISTGTSPGSNLTWSLGNTAGPSVSGAVWFLVSVNSGTSNGTLITNTASSSSFELSSTPSNSVTVTVSYPQLNVTKSESAASLSSGSSVTYTLAWLATGLNQELYDSYDSSSGTPSGYDGTSYFTLANGGTSGTWNLTPDSVNGGQYITANGGGTYYPMLLRSSSIDQCTNYTVEGDLNIDSTNLPNKDATMVIGFSGTATGNGYLVGISNDSGPGYIFLQKTVGGAATFPGTDGNIVDQPVFNTWYTVKAQVIASGASNIISIRAWKRGTAEPATWNLTYTDATPPSCDPSANYVGWQADQGLDYYDNLQVFGTGPAANYSITDTVPTGVTYAGSSVSPVSTSPFLSWSFPGTFYGQPVSLTWWGPVTCPGPISNQFAMKADTLPVTVSNIVSLTISGSCITPTPTNTPTPGPTSTFTPSPTVTLSPTLSPTSTPTATQTLTPSPTFTSTPTITLSPTATSTLPPPTATNTPVPPIDIWPIPFNPQYAFNNDLKISGLLLNDSVSFYTVSGELVAKVTQNSSGGALVTWDGKNKNNRLSSSGIYYYLIQRGGKVLMRGKLLIINGN